MRWEREKRRKVFFFQVGWLSFFPFLGRFHGFNNQTSSIWYFARVLQFVRGMSAGRAVLPLAPTEPGGLPPMEDERQILTVGTETTGSQVVTKPLLGSYLPVNPVQRYTFKKWAPADWTRNNESKKFQSNRDREASRV